MGINQLTREMVATRVFLRAAGVSVGSDDCIKKIIVMTENLN